MVTTLAEFSPGLIYDVAYCARGQSENFIKDFKNALRADRLSCHRFVANAFRLLLHAIAYQSCSTRACRVGPWSPGVLVVGVVDAGELAAAAIAAGLVAELKLEVLGLVGERASSATPRPGQRAACCCRRGRRRRARRRRRSRRFEVLALVDVGELRRGSDRGSIVRRRGSELPSELPIVTRRALPDPVIAAIVEPSTSNLQLRPRPAAARQRRRRVRGLS